MTSFNLVATNNLSIKSPSSRKPSRHQKSKMPMDEYDYGCPTTFPCTLTLGRRDSQEKMEEQVDNFMKSISHEPFMNTDRGTDWIRREILDRAKQCQNALSVLQYTVFSSVGARVLLGYRAPSKDHHKNDPYSPDLIVWAEIIVR